MSAPLVGVRVLLGGHSGPAAACAGLLAHLGADVHFSPGALLPGPGRRSNVEWESGDPEPHDIVISDLQPAEARARGLTMDDLLARARVALSVTPFGLDGPYADRSDIEVAGLQLDSAPASALAGAHAAVAGLGALRWARLHRKRVGVEVSTLEAVVACLGGSLAEAACPRPKSQAPGGRAGHARIAVLQCADGYVGVAAPTTIGRLHLAAATGIDAVRQENADLSVLLEGWLCSRTRLNVFHEAQLWRLPVVLVLDPEEALRDEDSTARKLWGFDAVGRPVARSPFRFLGEPRWPAAPLPTPPPAPERGRERARRRGALPLSDIRVLDLGMVWAGPHCGRLLAGLGARVVKVEGPGRPDGTRPPPGWQGCWGTFADLNGGKASLVINLSTQPGRDALLRVAAGTDVVLENFSPRVMPNFGLDYSAVSAVNPAVIMLSMPAFGTDGPWANYVAYGSGIELATGLWACATDGTPEPAAIPYLDYLAGAYGAAGILAVLIVRDRTGQGAGLEVAQRDVACQLLPRARPFPSSPLIQSPTPERRRDPEPPVSYGLPAFGVVPSGAALAADPHLIARRFYAEDLVQQPTRPPLPGGERRPVRSCRHYARPPWRLHGAPPSLTLPRAEGGLGRGRGERPSPGFGSDSRRVLRRWAGLDPEEIERLVQAGIVGAGRRHRPARAG